MGVPGLDDILRGGLPRRRIYLLQGDPGVGKTTLGLQFLLEGARQGEACLYVTLSETREELLEVAASHKWSLEGIHLHQLSAEEERVSAQQQNTLFHPAEIELAETIGGVLKLVDEIKPTRIVFDSLSEMRLLAGDSLRYRRQLLALKQHFAGRNSTVLFLDDGTSESGDTQLQSLAHGVISLERVAPEYGAVRRYLEVVKLRGVNFRSGRHDYSIIESGLEVYPRLIAAEHHADFVPGLLPSDSKDLDALLGGGLSRGTSTLLLGPAGSGKSTVAARYIQAALERGENVSLFSFDESLSTFRARVEGIGMRLEDPALKGTLHLRQVNPAELSPGEFAHLVRHSVTENKARLVIIDSLNGYLMAMPNEKHLVVQLHELLTYLNQMGMTTLMMLAQHGLLGGSVQAPVDVTYLADTVVLFRYFEAAGKVRKAISVLKKRTGVHEDTIREFQVSSDGIHLGAPLSNFRGVLTGTPTFEGNDNTLLVGKK